MRKAHKGLKDDPVLLWDLLSSQAAESVCSSPQSFAVGVKVEKCQWSSGHSHPHKCEIQESSF